MPETDPETERPEVAQVEVALRYAAGALVLDVSFSLKEPWSVLFAPSGAGKSTVLRLIAGLLRPSTGRIASIGAGQPGAPAVVLTDTSAGVSVPAFRRGIGFVAQEPALFPHMSVLRNVLYGVPKEERSGRGGGAVANEAMQLCRVAHLGAKRPSEISGGERQRVALARALAARPRRLLLLDEPFTGTDAVLRDVLTAELRPFMLRSGTPVLQVTHDLGDVLATEAEVLVMEAGRIVAQGPPRVVLKEQMDRLACRLTRRSETA